MSERLCIICLKPAGSWRHTDARLKRTFYLCNKHISPPPSADRLDWAYRILYSRLEQEDGVRVTVDRPKLAAAQKRWRKKYEAALLVNADHEHVSEAQRERTR